METKFKVGDVVRLKSFSSDRRPTTIRTVSSVTCVLTEPRGGYYAWNTENIEHVKPVSHERPISRLPKWAQKYIKELEERVSRAEKTLPWTKPGMEWFTILHPDSRVAEDKKEDRTLFFLRKDAAHSICTIGPMDCVFVGRGKKQ